MQTLRQNMAARLANDKAWRKSTFRFDASNLEVAKVAVDSYVTAWVAKFNGLPVGTVYTRSLTPIVTEVFDSYVQPCVRRHGVRTVIHNRILQDFEVLISVGASKEGQAWMRHAGYVFDTAFGWWKFHRTAKKK